MLRIPLEISWSCDYQPIEGRAWVIYVSRRRDEKGALWARCPIRERSWRIALWEGTWYVRVLMETCDCTEEPWERAEVSTHHVTGREALPVNAENMGCGVLPGGQAGVAHDPPAVDGAPSVIQVVECDPGQAIGLGVLRHEYEALPGGVLEDRGHGPKAQFALPGSVDTPGSAAYHAPSRTLCVGPVGLAGARGAGQECTGILPELAGFASILIAQVNTTAGTKTGFPTPTAYNPDAFEYNTAAGFRTLLMPAQSAAATYALMGPVGGPGLFADLPFLAPTFGRATIPTDEVDLGVEMVFMLEADARFRRTTAVADPWGTTPVCALRGIPMHPAHDDEEHVPSQAHQDAPQAYGPHYLMRDTLQSGTPRNPLRFCRFEVKTDTVTPITNDWQTYVPGMMLRGRYVQARIVLFDETGHWQIQTGDVEIRARIPERTYRTSVDWVGGTAYPGVRVTLPLHPITGGPLFPNQIVVTGTAHGSPAAGGFEHPVTISAQAAGAAYFDVMVWQAGVTAPQDDVVDLIATGY